MNSIMVAFLSIFFVLFSLVKAGPIENLKAGEWLEIPNSRMDVLKLDPQKYPGIHAHMISDVVASWCSAAYDTKRDRLITFGGGHNGYWGNEEHVFDLNTFTWERLTEPTLQLDGKGFNPGSCPFDINDPCAIHTYDGVDYLPPPVDRHVVIGWGGKPVYMFDFENLVWESKKGYTARSGENRTGTVSAVDPVSGLLFQHQCYTSQLSSFNPETNTWKGYGYGTYLGYSHTAAIDPLKRKFVLTGGGKAYAWDISNPNAGAIPKYDLSLSGDQKIQNGKNPGLDYDPVSEKFVAWNGGTEVYTLDLDKNAWVKHAASPTNSVSPTPPGKNGTYNRWRYVPSRNVFILLNSAKENVFIYKLTDAPAAPDWYQTLIGLGGTQKAWRPGFKSGKNAGLRVFPNPVRGFGNVRLTAPKGVLKVTLFSPAGKKIKTLSRENQAPFAWEHQKAAPGVYVARAFDQGREISRKILVF